MTAKAKPAKIELTKQQLDVVNHRPEGDLLVKGIPAAARR